MNVWTLEKLNIEPHVAEQKIRQYRDYENDPARPRRDCLGARVAIIGGGPKGFYALDSLCRAWLDKDIPYTIHIDWLDQENNFATGPNYQVDQPEVLLINYSIGNIACETYAASAVGHQFPSLYQWISQKAPTQQVDPRDFASRALVGCYYQHALIALLESIPRERVTLHFKDQEVVDLDVKDQTIRLVLAETEILGPYLSVMCATGNAYTQKVAVVDQVERTTSGFRYFKSAYPVDKLVSIPAQARVAVMGMGLTFVDVALTLTEGRGGTFERDASGRLVYYASGLEPYIHPFSTSNLPMIPRLGTTQRDQYRPLWLTDSWVLKRLSRDEAIDFESEVLPLIELEIAHVQKSYPAAGNTTEYTLKKLIDPKEGLSGETLMPYQPFLEQYLQTLITALQERDTAPLHPTIQAIRACLSQVHKLYNQGRFTAKAHRDYDQYWSGAFARICYGPPILNMEKILALMEAKQIVAPYHERVELVQDKLGITLKNRHIQNTYSYFIDARIARINLSAGNHRLYTNMLQKGFIERLANASYSTENMAVNEQGKSVKATHIALFFYGAPTEGSFLDNDTLNRQTYNTTAYWVAEIQTLLKNLHTYA